MSSIKKKVLLLFTIFTTVSIAFAVLTATSFKQYSALIDEAELSHSIIDNALSFHAEQTTDLKSSLEKNAQNLKPDFRSKAILSMIKNPTQSNLRFLVKVESEYRKYLAPIIIYFKERVLYFSMVTLFSILLFAFLLTTIVFRQLFSPLKDLSLKMDDFIQNKYSYKFTVPKMNEVGELQNTFNSLAQKVLVQIDDLKKLDVAKSEFLSIASHELRTPLTSIKGSLSLLNTGVAGQVTEVAKNLMNIALNETDRLIRLINELLDLAKIEARQFPLNHSWFSANQLIKNTFLSLQGFCTTAQVRLASDVDEHLELYIDADRIQQVLTNLISNAVKFSPKGEVVEVKAHEMAAGGVSIEVHDHGKGIAPEDQEIIFEKFRQASNAQNPLVKGTGLGLAIAKSLVEQHEGNIGVRSTPGSGSVFYFTLPKYRKTSQKLSDAS